MKSSAGVGTLAAAAVWPRWLVLAAAGAPVVAATLAVLLFATAESLGVTPFSYGPPRNAAEAAGMGSASEVLRLLATVDDPNRIFPVRVDIIASNVTRVTVMEAVVFTRRLGLVELLDDEGMIVGSENRRHLACLAADLNASDIVSYLAPKGIECVAGQTYAVVVARSEQP